MFTTMTKIHLFQTVMSIFLSILSIVILPSIQNLLIRKRQSKANDQELSFLKLLFSSEDFKNFKDNTVCPGELLIIIMFVMVLLTHSFVKTTYSSAFVCFIISLELVFFVGWPVKLKISGFNMLPSSVRYGDFEVRERYRINLLKYIRLLVFIPFCEAFIFMSTIDGANATHSIVTVCIYFVFNYIVNWVSSKYIFAPVDMSKINSDSTGTFPKEMFGITRDGLKVILFILLASAIFLKLISLL